MNGGIPKMDWLKFFRNEPRNTASLAKERLKVVVAHQREGRANVPLYLPRLREEILAVVRRYVQVSDEAVHINVQRGEGLEVLEMNITLPETGPAGQAALTNSPSPLREGLGRGVWDFGRRLCWRDPSP